MDDIFNNDLKKLKEQQLPEQEMIMPEEGEVSLEEIPVPDYREDLLNRYRQLNQRKNDLNNQDLESLQQNQLEGIRNAGLLQAGSQIAQAMASGYGAKIGDNKAGVDLIKDLSSQPVKDFLQKQDTYKKELAVTTEDLDLQDDIEMTDPKSDISKFYREQAYSLLKKLSPQTDYSGKLEDMSAKQLMKLPGMKNLMGANQKTVQQGQFITKEGDPAIFDPNTGKYINAVTGKTVEQSGSLYRPVMYNDAFGNRALMGPQGSIEVSSSKRADKTPEQQNKEAELRGFKPDKEQRGALDREKERVDNLTKVANTQLAQMNNLLDTLNSNSKMTKGVLVNALARASGEVGALTEGDKAPFVGSQAALDRLAQWIETNVSSTVTDSNKKEIRKLLEIYTKNLDSTKKNIFDASSQYLSNTYNIPPSFMQKTIKDIKPLSKSQEKLIKGKTELKANEIMRRDPKTGKNVIYDKDTKKPLRWAE